jgi:hypothetical protein
MLIPKQQFFVAILFHASITSAFQVQYVLGKTTRVNCGKLCREAGYYCTDYIMRNHICYYSSEVVCGNNPYMQMQSTVDPNQIVCEHGGGCYVDCGASQYLSLHQPNATCGDNYCYLQENQFMTVCPCGVYPTMAPSIPYHIEVSTTEEVGLASFLVASATFSIWLICCCFSTRVLKRL